MFDHPDINRQLVDDRLDARRRETANRRLAVANRSGRRPRLRLPRVSWFGRADGNRAPAPAPKPSTA